MAKHLTVLKDAFIAELIQFFTHCESKLIQYSNVSFFLLSFNFLIIKMYQFKVYGKDVKANVEVPFDQAPLHPGRNTVAYEARYLKWLLYEIIDY